MNEPATAVFGLTKSQLWPMVECAMGEAVASFDITIENEVRGPGGIMAEKVVPTFRCRTRSGSDGEVVVFAKRRHEPGPGDACQYRWLREYDAPIAGMYGAMAGADGREIILLEYLDVVTEPEPCESFLKDPAQFPEFLSAMARLNAIRPVGEHAQALRKTDDGNRGGPNDWRARIGAAARTLDDIWRRSPGGDYGEPMRRSAPSGRRARRSSPTSPTVFSSRCSGW